MARLEWVECEEPEGPSLLQRLAFRFWLRRRKNPKQHILVVKPKLEDEEGTWGTDFDAYIRHPDECFSPDDTLSFLDAPKGRWWARPIMHARCDMEEYLDPFMIHLDDWPDPPFRMPVHVNGETIRGFDWVEYDAWLEPIDGWPDDNQAQGG